MKIIFLKPFISAPVDIILMLLGAFIIGFVMAWLLRNARIKAMQEAGLKLKKKVRNLSELQENMEIEHMKVEEKLQGCQKRVSNMVLKEDLVKSQAALRAEKERSMTARSSLTEIENAHEALKKELEIKISQMISQEEATRLQAEANRLKVFNASLQEELTQLKGNYEIPPSTITDERIMEENAFEEGSEIQHPESDLTEAAGKAEAQVEAAQEKAYSFLQEAGIRTAQSGAKDDLKLISGVGPFIEDKLNNIGIYTFEQIASLSVEQTEKITEAIEFFPGRIQRDDWVGQARRLL